MTIIFPDCMLLSLENLAWCHQFVNMIFIVDFAGLEFERILCRFSRIYIRFYDINRN